MSLCRSRDPVTQDYPQMLLWAPPWRNCFPDVSSHNRKLTSTHGSQLTLQIIRRGCSSCSHAAPTCPWLYILVCLREVIQQWRKWPSRYSKKGLESWNGKWNTVIIPKNNLKIKTAPVCLPVTLHKALGRPVSIVFGSMHCTFELFRAEGKADYQTFFLRCHWRK